MSLILRDRVLHALVNLHRETAHHEAAEFGYHHGFGAAVGAAILAVRAIPEEENLRRWQDGALFHEKRAQDYESALRQIAFSDFSADAARHKARVALSIST